MRCCQLGKVSVNKVYTMKTNTSLAELLFDISVAEHAMKDINQAMWKLKDLEKTYHVRCSTSGGFYTAWARLTDSKFHLQKSISNLKRSARALRSKETKSVSGTRAPNRTLTGIG